MPITIGSNIASLMGQRRLSDATDNVSRSFERLSSGLRINRASDDAAGLAIATTLRSSTRVYSQAIRNINDGTSVLNIADGALESLSNITQRQMELAEQAANGTFSTAQRSSLNKEINALSQEYNRTLQTTSFNGQSLFQGQLYQAGLTLQAGFGSAETLSFNLGSQGTRTIGDGTYSGGSTANLGLPYYDSIQFIDTNGDGKLDMLTTSSSSAQVFLSMGNGDGTFQSKTGIGTLGSGAGQILLGDFNGDGVKDILVNDSTNVVYTLTGNSNGTFKVPVSSTGALIGGYGSVADLNGDGKDDLITDAGQILLGQSNGTVSLNSTLASTGTSGGGVVSRLVKNTELGGYTAIFAHGPEGVTAFKINSDGTWGAQTQTFATYWDPQTADFDGDGKGDLVFRDDATGDYQVFIGNGDGTFKLGQNLTSVGKTQSTFGSINFHNTLVDINNDGVADLLAATGTGVSAYIGNGDGTFKAGITSAIGSSSHPWAADLNGDGVFDLLTFDNDGGVRFSSGNRTTTLFTKRFDITSQANARDALSFLNDQLTRISLQRGSQGAFQSRLNIVNNSLHAIRENYSAAESRIIDVDIATETSDLIRNAIKQQASAAILSQANQQPALALQLLR